MGKFRPRVKGKGKRWQKGHSSSSNPTTKRYREAAKSRFFQENLGQSKLTSDALQKHDAFMGTKPEAEDVDIEESEATTFAGKSLQSFQTFASDWSACSNVSFSKFLKKFTSNSALHKEMLAVLAAVTEVIKNSGGSESTTEYFAALMTTLSVCESEDALGAVLTLLGMGIKSVPQSVLQKKFSESSESFINILTQYAESENQVILRAVIGCLSVLLRNQEAVVWKNTSTIQVLDSLLAFTTHTKPKVRKPAQHAVCAILKASCSNEKMDCHPAAAHVAKFCLRNIENSVSSMATQTTLLHTLTLVKETIGTFPKSQLKTVCETVLKVMTLSNVLVTSCGMQVLHSLFVSRPPTAVLPSTLNAQLISALYDYQPPVTDTQPTLAWLAVMQEAHVNLSKQDLALCCSNLPRLFTTLARLWLSDKPEILNNTTHALSVVVTECMKPVCDDRSLFCKHSSTIAKVFKTVQEGLKYQYHSAWKHILHLLAVFYRECGASCRTFMLPCLETLGELRDSYQFPHENELDNAVGQAIRSIGPKDVLSVIPLEITGREAKAEIKRSWLLPVLRESIHAAPLAFFSEYFLPLASLCRRRCVDLVNQGKKAESVCYELLYSQIWALLPSFCNDPPDIKASFKNIAKVLGSIITDYKELRLSIMFALRKLISRNQEGESTPKKKENIQELARFAKNYLPILFNLYTTKTNTSEEEGQRLAAYETIKIYFTITDSSLLSDMYDRAFQKLDATDIDLFVKKSVMDLLRALLPYQNSDNIFRAFSLIKKGISDFKNPQGQKKSYRLLEVLCSSDAENCREFTIQNLQEIQNILLKSLSTSVTSSRGARLRCLIHLVRHQPSTKSSIVQQILPEAILCCKDINERCRQAAFALLHEIGLAMLRWEEENSNSLQDEESNNKSQDPESLTESEDKVIREFMSLLLAGLAGSPHLASATLLALADITHHFKGKFPPDLLELLVDNACLLVTSSAREVAGAALSYLKQLIYSFPPATVGPFIPSIMKGFLGMANDCKRHFRRETHHMLDRMIRKYGSDAIERLVPKSDEIMLARLRNLRKLNARKQRIREEKKANNQNKEDSDDDDDNNFTVRARAKSIEEILAQSDDELDLEEASTSKVVKGSKKKRGQAWIQEEPGDIVDLADAMAASKITGTKPGSTHTWGAKVVSKKKDHGFKTAEDGRLIIADDSSDDNDDKPSRRKGRLPKVSASDSGSDGDDEVDNKSTAGSVSAKGRKRKLSASTDAQSTTTAGPSTKYRAGGSGIHRPISKAVSVKSGVSSRTAKTAKSDFGSEYRAKKAKGDVKKKNAPDPYAYVPLNPSLLNKRKKMKQAGQFKNIVRSARKGAAAGRVAKTRARK